MENKIKIFVVGDMKHYANFIEDHELVNDLADADVVLFTGGEDVTPSIYKCKKHQYTFCNTRRDEMEVEIFKQIDPKRQLAFGICRGSQFLCAVNGGILVQHCSGHALSSTHEIINRGGNVYEITSTHHQMQYPFTLPEDQFDIIYWSEYRLSSSYEGDKIDTTKIVVEPEIVLYTVPGKPRSLAVQGHPEMIPNSPVAKMISNLIKEELKNVSR